MLLGIVPPHREIPVTGVLSLHAVKTLVYIVSSQSGGLLVDLRQENLQPGPLAIPNAISDNRMHSPSSSVGCDSVLLVRTGQDTVVSYDIAQKSITTKPVPPECVTFWPLAAPQVDDDDNSCVVCCVDLNEGHSIALDCGHIFHSECIDMSLDHALQYRDQGKHITFNLAKCSLCCQLLRHPTLERTKRIATNLRKIQADAGRRFAAEHPEQANNVTGEAAMEQLKMYYYECSRCKEPYFGGCHSCAEGLGEEPKCDPKLLVCEDCATETHCPAHRTDHLLHKCAYCCNPAFLLRHGRHYVCPRCIAIKNKQIIPCPGKDLCAFSGHHPEGGHDGVAGCLACGIPFFNANQINLPPAPEPQVPTNPDT
jgi:hypothetical protein